MYTKLLTVDMDSIFFFTQPHGYDCDETVTSIFKWLEIVQIVIMIVY